MKKKNLIENLIDATTVLTICLTVLFSIVGIAFNVVYFKMSVQGFSMYPTVNANVPNANVDGDVAFVNEYSKIETGDLVVAQVNWYSKGPILKRVVASPGDYFQIKDEGTYYSAYSNGKLLYKKEKTDVSTHGIEGGTNGYYNEYLKFLENPEFANNVIEVDGEKFIVMRKNQYFLIGDNWGESTDCMHYGFVSKGRLMGKVDFLAEYGSSHTWEMIKQMIILTFVPNWL